MNERTSVEALHRGDIVKATEFGPEGRVIEVARYGWTIVLYGQNEMPYKHFQASLIVVRLAA